MWSRSKTPWQWTTFFPPARKPASVWARPSLVWILLAVVSIGRFVCLRAETYTNERGKWKAGTGGGRRAGDRGRMPEAGGQRPDPRCQTQDARPKTPDPRRQTQDARPKTPDPRHQTQ